MNKKQILHHVNALCSGEAALHVCDKLTERLRNSAAPAAERKEIPAELTAPAISSQNYQGCEAYVLYMKNCVGNIKQSAHIAPTVPKHPEKIPTHNEYVEQNTRGYAPFPLNFIPGTNWRTSEDRMLSLAILAAFYWVIPFMLMMLLFPKHVGENMTAASINPLFWLGWIVYAVIGLLITPFFNDDRKELEDQYQQLVEQCNQTIDNCKHQTKRGINEITGRLRGIDSSCDSVMGSLNGLGNFIGVLYNDCNQAVQTRNEALKKYTDEQARAVEVNSLWNYTVEEVIDDIENAKQRIRQQLDKLYAQNVIHPSCRNFEMMFCIREYLSREDCDTLNAAYSRCGGILRRLAEDHSLADLCAALREEFECEEECRTMIDNTLDAINRYLEEAEQLLIQARTNLTSAEATPKQHRAVYTALRRSLMNCDGRNYIANMEKNLHAFLNNPFY